MESAAAQQGLNYIAALYKIEARLREEKYSADEIHAYRQKHSEPIVTEFFSWVYEQRQRSDLLPSNPLLKGLNYISGR